MLRSMTRWLSLVSRLRLKLKPCSNGSAGVHTRARRSAVLVAVSIVVGVSTVSVAQRVSVERVHIQRGEELAADLHDSADVGATSAAHEKVGDLLAKAVSVKQRLVVCDEGDMSVWVRTRPALFAAKTALAFADREFVGWNRGPKFNA